MAAESSQGAVSGSSGERFNPLKLLNALEYMSTALTPCVEKKFKELQDELIKQFGRCNSEHKIIQKDGGSVKINCQCECKQNNCCKCIELIKSLARQPDKLNWNNTDVNKWSSDHWEIAYLFMAFKPQDDMHGKDVAGLLQLCTNCKKFPNKVKTQAAKVSIAFLIICFKCIVVINYVT